MPKWWGTCPRAIDLSQEAHQGACDAEPAVCKEETDPMSCAKTPPRMHSAQQDGHTGKLGQAWGFAQCCKTQATLSEKVENQGKMPTSEEHARGGNKEKTQSRS